MVLGLAQLVTLGHFHSIILNQNSGLVPVKSVFITFHLDNSWTASVVEVIAHGCQTPEHSGQATGAGQDVEEQSHILIRPGEASISCAPLHVRSSLAFTELLLDHPQLSREAVCHGEHEIEEIQDTVEAGQGHAHHSNVLKDEE